MKRILSTLIGILSFTLIMCARQPESGYRGFIDWSNSYRTELNFPGLPRYSTFFSGLSTTHGYQINPKFFAGVGIDIEHCSSLKYNAIAFYADGRADFKFGKFTPFGDIRVGYNFIESEGGVYFSPSIGYRFNWVRKVGVNFAMGLSLHSYSRDIYDIKIYDYTESDSFWYTYDKVGKKHGAEPYFTFRVGFDF